MERLAEIGGGYGKETNVENLGKENFNATILSTDNDGKNDNVQDVHVKLNTGLPLQKQHLTRRKFFSLVNSIYI